MIRRVVSPFGVVLVGTIAIAALTLTWLRGTAAEIAGKQSDRAKKTDVKPVRW